MGGDVSVAAKNNVFTGIDGQAAFLWATLKVFFRYGGKSVELGLDGQPLSPPVEITNVAVGNGQFHGGGMLPCPGASLTDGLLDVTTIERRSWLELIRDIRMLYSGAVYEHPKVSHQQVSKLIARSLDDARVEVDGEPAAGIARCLHQVNQTSKRYARKCGIKGDGRVAWWRGWWWRWWTQFSA